MGLGYSKVILTVDSEPLDTTGNCVSPECLVGQFLLALPSRRLELLQWQTSGRPLNGHGVLAGPLSETLSRFGFSKMDVDLNTEILDAESLSQRVKLSFRTTLHLGRSVIKFNGTIASCDEKIATQHLCQQGQVVLLFQATNQNLDLESILLESGALTFNASRFLELGTPQTVLDHLSTVVLNPGQLDPQGFPYLTDWITCMVERELIPNKIRCYLSLTLSGIPRLSCRPRIVQKWCHFQILTSDSIWDFRGSVDDFAVFTLEAESLGLAELKQLVTELIGSEHWASESGPRIKRIEVNTPLVVDLDLFECRVRSLMVSVTIESHIWGPEVELKTDLRFPCSNVLYGSVGWGIWKVIDFPMPYYLTIPNHQQRVDAMIDLENGGYSLEAEISEVKWSEEIKCEHLCFLQSKDSIVLREVTGSMVFGGTQAETEIYYDEGEWNLRGEIPELDFRDLVLVAGYHTIDLLPPWKCRNLQFTANLNNRTLSLRGVLDLLTHPIIEYEYSPLNAGSLSVSGERINFLRDMLPSSFTMDPLTQKIFLKA